MHQAFYKLDSKKQRQIINAALNEFAQKDLMTLQLMLSSVLPTLAKEHYFITLKINKVCIII